MLCGLSFGARQGSEVFSLPCGWIPLTLLGRASRALWPVRADACKHTHTRTCTHTHTHTHTHSNTRARASTHTRARARTCVYTHATHTRTQMQARAHAHTHMHTGAVTTQKHKTEHHYCQALVNWSVGDNNVFGLYANRFIVCDLCEDMFCVCSKLASVLDEKTCFIFCGCQRLEFLFGSPSCLVLGSPPCPL